MNAISSNALVLAGAILTTPVAAQVTFYEREGFAGRSFTTEEGIGNFERYGFNDRASSVVVLRNAWEVCEDARFSGRCVVLRPGRYPSLAAMSLNDRVSSARTVSRNSRTDASRYAAAPPAAYDNDPAVQVTFFEYEGFAGRSFSTQEQIGNLERHGFNDRASSVVVYRNSWEICEDARFSGRCAILRPGQYPSLAAMGLNDRVSSVRVVSRGAGIDDPRYAPLPVASYDDHRRDRERLYEARVTSVRAVLGPAERRCWVEQEQVVEDRSGANVPGAIVGAVIGGILGHQVGGGRGKDIATAGGAVAGAALGASVGRDGGAQQAHTQDVERCASVSSPGAPAYWEVTYNFRGQEHHVQMSARPGATVAVNERGEPQAIRP
ncbi:conserved exported hypothetical protein [Candidatus Accumulibacter aalborgensis]|uniref:Beta/gamma crystallin 'Greek key' domain-containing protein n=1 Tax=Candidatus Accumulibacter aalborgensis TaxID=1860102 RepID=A0A1A8XKW1_9PROT|nr:beta/gamma crystallin-related protein [Candidatus Accumulibacter aalborgensis]SBT05809.1 conserved exported hypothetical protein [Candidatus Accumulibacter aalborgensis]